MIDVDSMTEDELEQLVQETLVEAANSNSWRVSDEPVSMSVQVTPRELLALEFRAQEAGKTRDDYVRGIIGAALATS